MLRGEPVTGEGILRELPPDVRQKLERLTDALSDVLADAFEDYARGGGGIDVKTLTDVVDKFIQSLESTGKAGAVYSAPELLKKAADEVSQRLSQRPGVDPSRVETVRRTLKKVAEGIEEGFNSREFASKLVESVDPTKLSPEEWRRLVDEVMDSNISAGRGKGGGILDQLRTKIMVSPQFRFMLKEYLRDLRVAPGERESFHQIGKRVDARRTFRETARTGLPLIVFRKPIVKPRTKEDVIFIYDVSGSMSSLFALIASVAQALSDLGLNVKVWYAEEGGVKAVSRDFIRELEHFGGGGTNLAEATSRVLHEENLRHAVVILYSDLLEAGDPEEFVSNMEKMRSRGSFVAAFVTKCDDSNEDIRRDLSRRGVYLKCDVNTPRKFIEGVREIGHQIKKVALVA